MADPLSLETVNELAQLLNQTPPDQAGLVVAQMQREQPAVYDYLRALARPPFSRIEHERLFSIGVTVWQIMQHSARPPTRVTVEMLARTERAFSGELARLARMRRQEQEGRIALQVANYPEPAVLAFLTAAINRTTDPPFRQEARLVALQSLKVLLDALITSRARGPG
jgi:hypothetical protein